MQECLNNTSILIVMPNAFSTLEVYTTLSDKNSHVMKSKSIIHVVCVIPGWKIDKMK